MAEVTQKSEIEKLKAELEAEKNKNKVLTAAAEASNKKIKDLQAAAGTKAKDPNMVQYYVKQKCYWNGQLYYEEDIAEIPEGLTPPVDYFEKVSK